MPQLTFGNSMERKLHKTEFEPLTICACGFSHVFHTCPRCNMTREESQRVENNRNYARVGV